MRVTFRKLIPGAAMPSRAHHCDAGLDLHAVGSYHLPPGEFVTVSTGIAIDLPNGYEAQVRSRSGMTARKGVTVLGAPGTIDPGYTGEIKVTLINHDRHPHAIEHGARIAQLVVAPFVSVVPVDPDPAHPSRGDAGHGSTGD